MPRLIDHGLRDGKKTKKAKTIKQSPKPKGKKGRPTIYTEALGKEICDRLAGQESLRAICRDAHMPSKTTVLRWAIDTEHAFSDQYARAREVAYYDMEEEILQIADDATNDYVVGGGSEAKIVVDHDHISRSRLRIEARKWILSKRLPKIYGDKIQHTGDGGGPVRMSLEAFLDEMDGKTPRIPINDEQMDWAKVPSINGH